MGDEIRWIRRHRHGRHLVRNILGLKAFATLTKKKIARHGRHLGVLGRLLSKMSQSSKRSPVQQYKRAVASLGFKARGLVKYMLRHIRKEMRSAPGGIITIGSVNGVRGSSWARLKAK